MKNLQVISSNGELTVNKLTGEIIKRNITDEEGGLDKIVKFDLDEFRQHYKYKKDQVPDSIDILDLGYWYKGIGDKVEYEEPAHDWRAEFRNHSLPSE